MRTSVLKQFISFLLIFFIIYPVVLPTVMASYSFVGEKLNRSLEPLLATPTTDSELLSEGRGHIHSCMLATWLSFIPFTIIVTSWSPAFWDMLPPDPVDNRCLHNASVLHNEHLPERDHASR